MRGACLKDLSYTLSHKAGRRKEVLTLKHLLQLRLAADGGAAGRRAGCAHGDCSGHIVAGSSTAAECNEGLAVPASR